MSVAVLKELLKHLKFARSFIKRVAHFLNQIFQVVKLSCGALASRNSVCIDDLFLLSFLGGRSSSSTFDFNQIDLLRRLILISGFHSMCRLADTSGSHDSS